MRRIGKPQIENAVYIAFVILIALFFHGIVWVNLNAAQWYNNDIYTDSMVAKYMWEERTFFPEGWIFGNQFYIVATPALAAVLYGITSDTVLALGLASCVMTLLTLCAFAWCVYPFVQKKNLAVGLLCLIGGTLISDSASSDWEGMQIFFTMASYYACYLIGILFTMGIWLRLYFEKKVPWLLYVLAFLLNLALSMQSLREMLVLNLPLCALTFLLAVVERRTQKPCRLRSAAMFAAAMLAAGVAGQILIEVLKKHMPINQSNILSGVSSDILANMQDSVMEFLQYAGLYLPSRSVFSMFRFAASVVMLVVVVYSLFSVIRKRRVTPLAGMIQFCVISLGAVFCAGVLVISVRGIYYFVWNLLVALSFMYAAEELRMTSRLRLCLLGCLLLIGATSLFFNFRKDVCTFASKQDFYEEISDTLVEDGIAYVYYDVWGMDHAARVAAFSDDQITYCAYALQQNAPDEPTANILTYVKYLCHEEWFTPEKRSQAYLMLSGETLAGETLTFPCDELLSHLTQVHHFEHQGEAHYFYKFDDTVFQDMLSD